MKLIAENEIGNLSLIREELDESGQKNLFVEGIFAQAEKKNRNKRIYPKKVLENAMNKYIEDYVSKNRALGELNHPSCYVYNDFLVLTPTGWKPFTDINVGDEVICMNQNKESVVGFVEQKIEEPFLNDYIYHIKGRNIDSEVTSNHRFYCLDRNDNIVVKTAEELYENSSHLRIIKSFNTSNSDSIDTIIIKKIDDIKNPWAYKRNVWEDLALDSKEFCKFLGFWLAEGHINGNTILVTQNSGTIAEEYKKVLSNLGIEYNVQYSNSYRNMHEIIYFSDKRIVEYLKPLGNCYTKYIPKEIKNLSKECLLELLNWFAKGDGRTVINGSNKRKRTPLNIFSTSKKLIDDFNEVILKLGMSCKIHEYNSNNDYIYAEHLIKCEKKHTLYQLNISCVSGIHLDRRFIKINRRFENAGMAYCLRTTYGNFYVNDKGNQYLTGNCVAPNPERACILIQDLHWKGNDVLGKAKVLSTPTGEIVKSLIRDGVQLGVSTRGIGTLTEKNGDSIVESDYTISAIDVVSNPSGMDCWINGVLENVEFYYENGQLCESTIDEYLKHKKKGSIIQIQEDFKKFLENLIV